MYLYIEHIVIHPNLLTLPPIYVQTRDYQFGTIQEVDMSLQIQFMKNNDTLKHGNSIRTNYVCHRAFA